MRDLRDEISFKTSRSSGKGGQNVNKVSTKVEAAFHVANSQLLTDEEKLIINTKLSNRITDEGELKVTCQESRSQLDNKEKAVHKLHMLIEKALTPVKQRRKTKPSKASKEKRLKSKKAAGEIKKLRKKDF
jgi:ribosome-associated protein